jgi:Predicted membrane-associated HD superfamily hydrolase
MKKSNFTAMVLGTVGGVLFALGMCMCLLPAWNAFKPGVIMGCIGLVVLFITLGVWRKMENKASIRFSGKSVLAVGVGIGGAILLGVGMCLAMVWSKMVFGILVGLAGIILLLALIPLIRGIK